MVDAVTLSAEGSEVSLSFRSSCNQRSSKPTVSHDNICPTVTPQQENMANNSERPRLQSDLTGGTPCVATTLLPPMSPSSASDGRYFGFKFKHDSDEPAQNPVASVPPCASATDGAGNTSPVTHDGGGQPPIAGVASATSPTAVPATIPATTAASSRRVSPGPSKRMPRLQAVVRRIGSTLAAASGSKALQSKRETKHEKDFLKAYLKKFDADEVEVLRKVYKELSARNPGPGIDKETFLQYFPLPGLWGERLFQRFDYKCLGAVDYEEFLVGIAVCCRGTKCERIHVLFQVFDLNGDGVLQKDELVAMLSNLPNLDRYIRKQSPLDVPRDVVTGSRSSSFFAGSHAVASIASGAGSAPEEFAATAFSDDLPGRPRSTSNTTTATKPLLPDTSITDDEYFVMGYRVDLDFDDDDDEEEADDEDDDEDDEEDDRVVGDGNNEESNRDTDDDETRSHDHLCAKLGSSLVEPVQSEDGHGTTTEADENVLDYLLPHGGTNGIRTVFSEARPPHGLLSSGPCTTPTESSRKATETTSGGDQLSPPHSQSGDRRTRKESHWSLKPINAVARAYYPARRESAFSSTGSVSCRDDKGVNTGSVVVQDSVLNTSDAIDVEAFVDKIIEECEFSESDTLTFMEFKTWLERNDAILAMFTECLHEEAWGLQGNALYRRSGYPGPGREETSKQGRQLYIMDHNTSHDVERRKRGIVEVRPDSFYKVKRLFTVSARSTFSALAETNQQRQLQKQTSPAGDDGKHRRLVVAAGPTVPGKTASSAVSSSTLRDPNHQTDVAVTAKPAINEGPQDLHAQGSAEPLAAGGGGHRLRPPALSDVDAIGPRETREGLNVQLLDLIMTANPNVDVSALQDEINSGGLDDENSLFCCPSCRSLLVVCPRCHRRLPSLQLSHGMVVVQCHNCLEDKPYQFHNCWHCHWNFSKASELVDQCEPLYEGVLYKIGRHTHKWRRRYFVLVDNLLYYYGRKEDTKPRGFFFMEGCFVESLGGNRNDQCTGGGGGLATVSAATATVGGIAATSHTARGDAQDPLPASSNNSSSAHEGKKAEPAHIDPAAGVTQHGAPPAGPGDILEGSKRAPAAYGGRPHAHSGSGTSSALRFPKLTAPGLGVSGGSGASGGTCGGKYGFSIVHGVGKIPRRDLYANTFEERELWMKALRHAMNQQLVDELYKIEEVVGQGKFSMVHRALTRDPRRRPEDVAIKVIEKSKMSSHERELLRSEVAILRLLRHPHVISLREILDSCTHIYIVMEYVKGGELYDLIQQKRKLPEPHVNRIIFQLLSTVAYLHKCGIIHRDLKPENILLTDSAPSDDADIKITDFGLSCICGPDELVTQPCGTLAYVAPEVLTLGGYNHKVDVWSVGVIMFLLLRGRLPFPVTASRAAPPPPRPEPPTMLPAQQPTTPAACQPPPQQYPPVPSRYLTPLAFEGTVWSSVSSSAKDLLRKLLQPYPEKRISAQEALEHIWIKNPTAVISEAAGDLEQTSNTNVIPIQKPVTVNYRSDGAANPVPLPDDATAPDSLDVPGNPVISKQDVTTAAPQHDKTVLHAPPQPAEALPVGVHADDGPRPPTCSAAPPVVAQKRLVDPQQDDQHRNTGTGHASAEAPALTRSAPVAHCRKNAADDQPAPREPGSNDLPQGDGLPCGPASSPSSCATLQRKEESLHHVSELLLDVSAASFSTMPQCPPPPSSPS